MTKKTKTEALLKDITFEEGDNPHLALVHRDQGGPANGAAYKLVIKSTEYSDEFLEKAAEIGSKLSLELDEFLIQLHTTDVDVLAKALGCEEGDLPDDYLAGQVQDMEFIKSLLHPDVDVADAVLGLEEDRYLAFLQDQAVLEKALTEIDKEQNKPKKRKLKVKKNSTSVKQETAGEETPSAGNAEGGETPVTKTLNKESKDMTKEITTQVVEKDVEVIEKSQFDAIQKSLTELQKANEQQAELIKQFEQEKKEQITKARKDKLSAVCGEDAETIFKACNEAQDEDFDAVVQVLAKMKEQKETIEEQSELFKEAGVSASVEQDADDLDPLTKALNARLSDKQ